MASRGPLLVSRWTLEAPAPGLTRLSAYLRGLRSEYPEGVVALSLLTLSELERWSPSHVRTTQLLSEELGEVLHRNAFVIRGGGLVRASLEAVLSQTLAAPEHRSEWRVFGELEDAVGWLCVRRQQLDPIETGHFVRGLL